ncbi:MAG: glycosyltransferase [DPANN group archaeon]|nr:glycosyltransferase [DPANN group archaeon]
MRLAVFHDYFDEIGGAEITLLYLAAGLNATIYTTNIDRQKINQLGFKKVNIKSIGSVPSIRHLKQLVTQLRFSFLKIRGFDRYVFGGPYSIYALKKHKPNLWFCFSPLRGLYDLRYFKKGFFEILKQPIKEIQIYFDKKAVKNIQKIICNSQTTMNRIKEYYNLDSKVIYSPVDTTEFNYEKYKNYWLSVSRIDPYKRIELIISAFSKIPDERLVVVGGTVPEHDRYLRILKKNSTKNVSFTGPIYDRKRLADLYAHCKGLITTAKDEDFGKTPIEAMASGKPVIAPNEGGYKETVVDGVTGKLIDDINSNKLAKAIKEVGKNPESYKSACLKQAKKFDTKEFIKKIKKEIL